MDGGRLGIESVPTAHNPSCRVVDADTGEDGFRISATAANLGSNTDDDVTGRIPIPVIMHR